MHREIKPGNVMIDAKGRVTVMDFGLGLLTEGSTLTQLDTNSGADRDGSGILASRKIQRVIPP